MFKAFWSWLFPPTLHWVLEKQLLDGGSATISILLSWPDGMSRLSVESQIIHLMDNGWQVVQQPGGRYS